MSHITAIKGWIEIDGSDQLQNHLRFQEAIKQLRCQHGYVFGCQYSECEEHKYKHIPNMFAEIPDSGTKNPHYIVFAATLNYADVDEFTEFFEEELLTRLSGFQAFVFVSTEQTKSFCKRYKGKRKEGAWELVETLEFFSDDIGECSLESCPKISDLFRYPDVSPEVDSIARMLLRLF